MFSFSLLAVSTLLVMSVEIAYRLVRLCFRCSIFKCLRFFKSLCSWMMLKRFHYLDFAKKAWNENGGVSIRLTVHLLCFWRQVGRCCCGVFEWLRFRSNVSLLQSTHFEQRFQMSLFGNVSPERVRSALFSYENGTEHNYFWRPVHNWQLTALLREL